MRTTLTLEDDVAARLKAEAQRSGKSFKAVVNECLRLALTTRRVRRVRQRFKVRARDLGQVRVGVGLDNIGELLEIAEGPLHR